jgi:predicted alpha/beta superfamily hydrolase
MTRPENFGRIMLFSPSIWIDPQLPSRWPEHPFGKTYVYLYGGMEEAEGTAATFALLAHNIRQISTAKRKIYLRTHFAPRGVHNETAWGKAFPKAVAYLFSHD